MAGAPAQGKPAASVSSVAAARHVAEARSGLLVLGVDPANRCGWSAWMHGGRVGSGVVDSTDRQGGVRGVDVLACFRVFRQLQKDRSPDRPGVLVVESQHPIPDKRRKEEDAAAEGSDEEKQRAVRMRGLEALMREVEARQTWEVFAEQFGWRIVRVHPATWQAACLSRKPGMKRPELKERSKLYARSLGVDPRDDNEADAVCIGYWWITGGDPPGKEPAVRRPRRDLSC